MALLVIGLAVSIPLIVAGAALIMALLDRFPILVWAGAALLGWIVGEVIATDPVIGRLSHRRIRHRRSRTKSNPLPRLVGAVTGAAGRRASGGARSRSRRRAKSSRPIAAMSGRDESDGPRSVRRPMRIGVSACPHDCPSTCALEVELLDERTIGRVRGAKDNDYTAGVICAKVARYAEREHHPGPADCSRCGARAPRARASSRRSPGTTRSISSPRSSCKPSSATARKPSGRITTPAPWAW